MSLSKKLSELMNEVESSDDGLLFSAKSTLQERYGILERLSASQSYNPETEVISKFLKSNSEAEQLQIQGNLENTEGRFASALNCFNKSILFAPTTSGEAHLLGRCFTGRADVLFVLKHYPQCLADLESAFVCGIPDKDANELSKSKCLKAIGIASCSDPASTHSPVNVADHLPWKEIPDITGRPSFNVACTSDSMTLSFSEDQGRHLIANRDIRIGEVLVVEPAYSSILYGTYFPDHCLRCLQRCSVPYPCRQCNQVRYCSRECESTCWSDCHKYECLILCHLSSLDDSLKMMMTLSLRMILNAGHKTLFTLYQSSLVEPTNDGTTNIEAAAYPTSYHSVHNLMSHADQTAKREQLQFISASYILVKLLNLVGFFVETEDNFKPFVWSLLVKNMQIDQMNSLTIYEHTLPTGVDIEYAQANRIGVGIFAASSLFNHSCDPNLVREFYGTTVVMRACKPIKKGGNVTISYCLPYSQKDFTSRQAHLSNHYHFMCLCQACIEKWAVYECLRKENYPILGCIKCNCELTNEGVCRKCSAIMNTDQTRLDYDTSLSNMNQAKENCDQKDFSENSLLAYLDVCYHHYEFLSGCVLQPSRLFIELRWNIGYILQCLGHFYRV